jgi:hypothetical protein
MTINRSIDNDTESILTLPLLIIPDWIKEVASAYVSGTLCSQKAFEVPYLK